MPEITDSELRLFAAYQNLGSPQEIQKKVSDFEADNQKQRDTIRELKETVPKDGEVVVKKTDADRLAKYTELGKPEDVQAQLKEGTEAKGELKTVKRTVAAQSFAKATGLADEAVETLIAIPALEGATFEVKREKVKDAANKEVETDVGYILLPSEDGKTTESFTFEKAKEKVPALKGLRTAEPDKQQDRRGPDFVNQGGDSKGAPGGSVYDRIRQERENENKPREEDKDRVDPLKKQFNIDR